MKRKTAIAAVLSLALLVLAAAGLLPGIAAGAAADENTGGIGFYVREVIPHNQVDQSLTYFDLRVEPGQAQQLEVEVVNEAGEDIVVDIAAISASTNRNGVIDYKTPGIRDHTLKHPFSELAVPEAGSLRVPAGGAATARITVTLPKEEYDGVVLGGLVFTRRTGGARPGAGGVTLQNVYSYVLGVKLSESDTAVSPDFELESVRGETVNYQPALVHFVRNKNAAIAKGIDLHVVVRDKNGEAVADAGHRNVDMAPNSVMPLAVAPAAGGEGRPELAPGDYVSEVTLTQGGQSWRLEQKFTIGRVEAEQVNVQAIGDTAPAAPGLRTDTLLVILLAVAVAAIVALFVIILLLLRRRAETKELNRLKNERLRQLRLREKYSG